MAVSSPTLKRVAFSRWLPAFLFALALSAVMALVAVAAAPARALSGDGSARWKLVWQDEFNGAAGTPPDSSKWGYDSGCSGEGNNELECYTRRPQNVSLDGAGDLQIVARHESYRGHSYTSGRILTKGLFSRRYGRFEARMKIPSGQGTWPAFWMLGANYDRVVWPRSGEIDVMEAIGRQPATVYGSIHGVGYDDSAISTPYRLARGTLADRFHVYAVEWSPKGIAWYIDNVRYAWKTPRSLPAGALWAFDHPFFLILNLAIGGDWPGPPSSSSVFPSSLLVDYVRVYKRSGRDSEAPDPPTRLRIERRGARTLRIAWDFARDDVGVTSYALFIGQKRMGRTTKTRFAVNGLRPATRYVIRVRAYDAAGNRSISATIRARTCETTVNRSASTRC